MLVESKRKTSNTNYAATFICTQNVIQPFPIEKYIARGQSIAAVVLPFFHFGYLP